MGVSLIWNIAALKNVHTIRDFVSLYQFFQQYNGNWEHIDDVLLNRKTLVVAGLDAAMDTFEDIETLTSFLEQTLHSAIRSYQHEVADGGGEAGLIFYFANPKRFKRVSVASQEFVWKTNINSNDIPLTRLIYNGAWQDVKIIYKTSDSNKDNPDGLYLRRIS
jgi:hypothetical protein